MKTWMHFSFFENKAAGGNSEQKIIIMYTFSLWQRYLCSSLPGAFEMGGTTSGWSTFEWSCGDSHPTTTHVAPRIQREDWDPHDGAVIVLVVGWIPKMIHFQSPKIRVHFQSDEWVRMVYVEGDFFWREVMHFGNTWQTMRQIWGGAFKWKIYSIFESMRISLPC